VDHSYPLTTKKRKTTLHTTLKQNKTNLVQDIKGGCSKHLPRMFNCVGKNITSNKPRCLVASKKSNYEP
jgi:hypothetical protein